MTNDSSDFVLVICGAKLTSLWYFRQKHIALVTTIPHFDIC